MGMRIVACSAVFLVCVSLTTALGGNERARVTVSGDGISWNSGESHLETAERIWTHGRKQLQDKDNVANFYSLYTTEKAARFRKLTESHIHHNARISQPPSSNQTLVNRQEADLWIWFVNSLASIFTLSNYQGRKLANEQAQITAPSPAPNISPGPAVSGPESYGPGPAYSPSESPYSPVEAPERSHVAPFLSPKEAPDMFPSNKSVTPKKQHEFLKELAIAVVSTAVITFALVALLFFCCFRGIANRRQRDERPLLHLTHLSAGSSGNSSSLASSSDQQQPGIRSKRFPSFVSSLSMKVFHHDPPVANASHDIGPSPLKPPPGKEAPPPPEPPPPPPPGPPPPPPKIARPPPAPPKGAAARVKKRSGDADDPDKDSDAPKAKLKPFFWDKVMANSDQAMVWHEINDGSFQFNEEKIESLFGYNDAGRREKGKDPSIREPSVPYIQIIDPRKAQNLSILLRALNVTTEEVIDAIHEGNELPVELLHTLLKMAPTSEEELKLRLFSGEMSQLGPAERFLKILVDIPFAFKRIESLLFMSSLQEDVTGLKESFITLEVACKKLRSSRLFMKLLEAVLKTGNRMNDGTYRGGAQAFKLDTLLKLSDVKGTDGKTTLLNFVVQEIIRSEGVRAVRTQTLSRSHSSIKSDDSTASSSSGSAEDYRSLGLQVVSGLSTELEDVKKAALIDADVLAATMSQISNSLIKSREFLNKDVKRKAGDEEDEEESDDFERALAGFITRAEADIKFLSEEESRIMELVKNTGDYFHGNAGKNEGLRLFAVVRDFLIMLDKACKNVRDTTTTKRTKKEAAGTAAASPCPDNKYQSLDIRQRLFPAIAERRLDSSDSSDSSDDDQSHS